MKKESIILFRRGNEEENEFNVAEKYFHVIENRTLCMNNMVICRYSALPFYAELEQDLKYRNCSMVNTFKQHRWIADFEYYEAVKEYTPESWNEYEFETCQYDGPFVIKGKTNSRKWDWKRSMFAPDKKTARHMGNELLTDSMIGEQGVVFRKYIPLKELEIGINQLPFSNEWRFFYYKTTRLCYGYYWSVALDETKEKANIDETALSFADKIAETVSSHVNFFVLDIAEKQDGGWILIEINDGQMSGLSEIPSDCLYKELAIQVNKS